mgnify:CR=1 FL=1
MKHITTFTTGAGWRVLCAALLLTLSGLASAAVPAYRTVPLQAFPGEQISNLSSLDTSKPVYIKMWATWCQPCMQQMPHFQKLYQQFGDKVNFVAVNIDINEAPKDIQQVVNKFGLTMPVWRDVEGKLAVQLGLVGTPFSVLLNTAGEQVYSTHESDQALDGFLARLAQGQQLPPATNEALSAEAQLQRLKPFLTGEHLLFISATWCDWYLKESRPAMSAQCQQAQQQLNALAAKLPKAHWTGIVNHLWTDDKALAEFNTLYKMQVPFQIDQNGLLFQHFNVRQIPVLLKVANGKVLQEITDFSDPAQVISQLENGKKG